MQSKLTHYFAMSAVALLVAFASALLLCHIANANLIPPNDPLFGVSINTLFWILEGGALAVALVTIFLRQPSLKLAMILWFATNVFVYWMGMQWERIPNGSGYLGGLAQTFNLSDRFTLNLLGMLFLYLVGASAVLLVWNTCTRTKDILCKTICAHCGGHIVFSPCNLGQSIPCPLCQKVITLRKPINLKMSCFFCQGHIEFPVHAIGVKMPCPHCKMDIALKEPA